MSRLQLAIEQIVFARNYTIGLLNQTPTDEWFRVPAGGVSHVAWQVGHIAFSEYRLALWRIETTFYDARCVQVIDPFGNRIRFNEDLKNEQTA